MFSAARNYPQIRKTFYSYKRIDRSFSAKYVFMILLNCFCYRESPLICNTGLMGDYVQFYINAPAEQNTECSQDSSSRCLRLDAEINLLGNVRGK